MVLVQLFLEFCRVGLFSVGYTMNTDHICPSSTNIGPHTI